MNGSESGDVRSSSVWRKYVEAKKMALNDPEDDNAPPQTLEQLEAAIAEAAASSGVPETGLPPRAVVHPSKQRQLSRWFYLTLVVLFTALVCGLLWWGNHKYT